MERSTRTGARTERSTRRTRLPRRTGRALVVTAAAGALLAGALTALTGPPADAAGTNLL